MSVSTQALLLMLTETVDKGSLSVMCQIAVVIGDLHEGEIRDCETAVKSPPPGGALVTGGPFMLIFMQAVRLSCSLYIENV